VEDHSRLAYTRILADEEATTSTWFLLLAVGLFERRGVTITLVMTDSGSGYRLTFSERLP
jgi:hypothetical protein